jgi:hypothetical protein
MRVAIFVLALTLPGDAFAQATVAQPQEAVVTAVAPIYVKPGATVPLRTAAIGTLLRVMAEDGDWVQVQFNDPQWGLRTGWVQARQLNISRAETTPMDLSVGHAAAAASSAAPVSQAPFVPRPRTTRRPRLRNHTVGRTGVTFGTATAALAGVEVSGDVLSVLQVYGAFDWHQDVIPKDVRNALSLLAAGLPLELKVPTYVGIGGVKAIAPTAGVRPYAIGGFGVARSVGKFLLDGEDQTELLLGLAGFSKSDLTFTKPIFEVGGGMVIPAGRAYFDVGYRFRKAIDIEGVNMSGMYFGAGFSY